MRLVEGVVRIDGDASRAGEVLESGEAVRPDDTSGPADAAGAPPRFADVDAFVAALGDVGDRHGCAVQAFDARLVAGRAHLTAAVDHARRAFDRDENVARDLAVEVLLYAAGRRQINRALGMGVGAGETPAVVVVAADESATDGGDATDEERRDGASEGGVTADEDAAAAAVGDLLDPTPTLDRTDEDRIGEFFGITDAERAATTADLADLVVERVALLDVEK